MAPQPLQPQLAQQLIEATTPRAPIHAVFAWSLTAENNARFSGRGSLRMAPHYMARQDLFGPRGETLLASAVVGDEVRFPPNVADFVREMMPPVALSWAVAGVLRPPAAATLELTSQSGDTVTLGYARGDEHWRFRAVQNQLEYAEWTGANGRHTVTLTGPRNSGLPQVAVYRDLRAFRELTLTLEKVNEAAPFPADIWQP